MEAKIKLTDAEKCLLKAIVENAHASGDNGVEFIVDDVARAVGKSVNEVAGICSSLQRKAMVEMYRGGSYFDGKITSAAEEWYNKEFNSLILSSPDQHYWNLNGAQQAEMDRLLSKFMPPEGRAKNFVGEVIRAINRLYYEFCNNGNCNALDSVVIPGDWVVCSTCGGTGSYYDEEEDEECPDCNGEGGYYEDDEYDYFLNPFYENFILLIRQFFDIKNCKQGIKEIDAIKNIIENKERSTDQNISHYDRCVDYIVWLVLNDEDNDQPIPDWYEN